MGYIFGIVGVVSVGSVFCGILYYLFNSRSNLEDANANYREDRRFGNYRLCESIWFRKIRKLGASG